MVSEEDKPLPISLFLNTPSLKHDSALTLACNISSDRFVSPFGCSTPRVNAFTPLGPSSIIRKRLSEKNLLSPVTSRKMRVQGLGFMPICDIYSIYNDFNRLQYGCAVHTTMGRGRRPGAEPMATA